jgi:hypothetical protein
MFHEENPSQSGQFAPVWLLDVLFCPLIAGFSLGNNGFPNNDRGHRSCCLFLQFVKEGNYVVD